MHGISRRGINHLFYEITKYCKLLDSFIVYDIILLAVIDIDINTNDMLNLFYQTNFRNFYVGHHPSFSRYKFFIQCFLYFSQGSCFLSTLINIVRNILFLRNPSHFGTVSTFAGTHIFTLFIIIMSVTRLV